MYIYIHIPFCASRCIYCDFAVVLARYGGQDAYIDALCREIHFHLSPFNKSEGSGEGTAPHPDNIQTLYVGGGTPSLLSARHYRRIFDTLRQYAEFAPDAEITLEANPGGHRGPAMADDPQAYLEAGFNRISVGVQSFSDAELKKLSRIHTAREAEAFIRLLQTAGWRNISIDLMYGLPLQTAESWQETLERTIALGVQHVSMYGLKVEDGTPLARLTRLADRQTTPDDPAPGYVLPEEDVNVAMYFEGLARLREAGYQRYEFSNLALPGYASRHNLNYWNHGEFLGLGLGAHGYVNGRRTANTRDFAQYLADPTTLDSDEPVSQTEQLENTLIFGLRKAEGVDITALESRFGIDFRTRYAHVLRKFSPDYLQLEENQLTLPETAIPLSNAILAEFLEV